VLLNRQAPSPRESSGRMLPCSRRAHQSGLRCASCVRKVESGARCVSVSSDKVGCVFHRCHVSVSASWQVFRSLSEIRYLVLSVSDPVYRIWVVVSIVFILDSHALHRVSSVVYDGSTVCWWVCREWCNLDKRCLFIGPPPPCGGVCNGFGGFRGHECMYWQK
jgi:hypothetical protein